MFATLTTVLAAPNIPATTPPFADKILNVAGWAIFAIGLSLVLAFAVGLAHLAWAQHHHRAGMSVLSLGIVMICGIMFGALGGIMNGLF